MEDKFYLVDIEEYEGDISELNNEQFKEVSRKQGLVFSRKQFENSFNYGGRVNINTQQLRIL